MRYFILVPIMVLLALSGVAYADEVKLKNGEHLKGKVLSLAGGKLKIKSDTAGNVTVPLKEVSSFSTDEPVEIHFSNGTIFNQKVASSVEGMIKIEVQPNQPQAFRVDDIEKINPPKSKWSGNLSAGFSMTRGNSYSNDFNSDFEAVRRGDDDRFKVGAGYRAARQKDPDTNDLSTTERKSYADLQYDLFFTEKFYGYAKSRFERDAVADIDLRFMGGIGAGYQWIEEEDLNFSTEAGLSWISENFKRPTKDEEYMSARVAYHVDGKFNSVVTAFHNTEWFPGFESEGGHYVKTDAGLRSYFMESFFAQFKVLWSWDSTPAIGKERTDVTYLFSLGYSF